MPAEEKSSEGFYIPGVTRPKPMTVHEMSVKGGQSRSQAKLAAAFQNLERARQAREAKRRASTE